MRVIPGPRRRSHRPKALVALLAIVLALAACAEESGTDGDPAGPSSDDKAGGLLQDAYATCSAGEAVDWKAYGSQAPPVDDVIQLSDDGNSISIKTPRTQGEDLGNLSYYVGDCILTETGAPKSVSRAMVRANLAGSFDLHKETYDASSVPATIRFEWYDHESDKGTSWDATFQAEPAG